MKEFTEATAMVDFVTKIVEPFVTRFDKAVDRIDGSINGLRGELHDAIVERQEHITRAQLDAMIAQRKQDVGRDLGRLWWAIGLLAGLFTTFAGAVAFHKIG